MLTKLILSGFALALACYMIPEVHFKTIPDAIVASVFLVIMNVLVRPILVILTFPITVMTLGFSLLVINALMILLVEYFVDGFVIDNLLGTFFLGIILSLLNGILTFVMKK